MIKKDYITVTNEQVLNEENVREKYSDLKKIFSKYKDLKEKNCNEEIIEDKIYELFQDLYACKMLCSNYQELIDVSIIPKLNELQIMKYSILECLVALTVIHRMDYYNGGYPGFYLKYVRNGIIPAIIDRILTIIN